MRFEEAYSGVDRTTLDPGGSGAVIGRVRPDVPALHLVDRYRRRHDGWSVKHYYSWYRRDGSPHEWVPGQRRDLIVTMDDATNEHYSMFFCAEEGTQSSFQGVREVMEAHGLFCSLYTDRGSHYWTTPEAGSKVDKVNLTQFGRAMKQLGIGMIPAYSPEARGRSEWAFGTHQARLPRELALAGITDMDVANACIRDVYLPAFNPEFAHPSREAGSAFVPCPASVNPDDILCEQVERSVRKDNCVRLDGLALKIPADRHRYHYIKAKVKVCRHTDGIVSVFHGPRRLARYDSQGQLIQDDTGRLLRNVRRTVGTDNVNLAPVLLTCFSVKTKTDVIC